MASENKNVSVIYNETMKENGFLFKLREDEVDKESFRKLFDAVNALALETESHEIISKLAVACLFEVPWEMENTVEHYSEKNEQLGREVSMMAEELREAVEGLLWGGLEKYYE